MTLPPAGDSIRRVEPARPTTPDSMWLPPQIEADPPRPAAPAPAPNGWAVRPAVRIEDDFPATAVKPYRLIAPPAATGGWGGHYDLSPVFAAVAAIGPQSSLVTPVLLLAAADAPPAVTTEADTDGGVKGGGEAPTGGGAGGRFEGLPTAERYDCVNNGELYYSVTLTVTETAAGRLRWEYTLANYMVGEWIPPEPENLRGSTASMSTWPPRRPRCPTRPGRRPGCRTVGSTRA